MPHRCFHLFSDGIDVQHLLVGCFTEKQISALDFKCVYLCLLAFHLTAIENTNQLLILFYYNCPEAHLYGGVGPPAEVEPIFKASKKKMKNISVLKCICDSFEASNKTNFFKEASVPANNGSYFLNTKAPQWTGRCLFLGVDQTMCPSTLIPPPTLKRVISSFFM